jgi:hypothetical protein
MLFHIDGGRPGANCFRDEAKTIVVIPLELEQPVRTKV